MVKKKEKKKGKNVAKRPDDGRFNNPGHTVGLEKATTAYVRKKEKTKEAPGEVIERPSAPGKMFKHPSTHQGVKSWVPHPGPQTEALRRREFEILYGGARGGGKSEAGRAWLIIDHNHPLFRALVIRRNADDLSDWLDKAMQLYKNLGATIKGKPPIIEFPDGGLIRTGHLKDDQSYTKYQGHEYQRILIEELTQIPDLDRYLRLLSSCRSTVEGLEPRVFVTANPGGVGHQWVKERFIDVCPPGETYFDPITGRGRIFIPAKIDDNPTLLKSDPHYMHFLDSLPTALKRAWRDGDWDVFAGQYFADFKRERHVVEPFVPPEHWLKIRGLDYGYNDPSCCLWAAVRPDGHIYVYRELYQSGLVYSALAQRITDMTADSEQIEYTSADTNMFAATKDMGEYGHDIMGDNGVPITPANKERVAGWNLLREYLRDDRISIASTCVNLIRTLPTLVHDEKRLEDLDTKQEDHAADTLRYLLMSRPPIPDEMTDEQKHPNPYENDPDWIGNQNNKSGSSYNKLYSL